MRIFLKGKSFFMTLNDFEIFSRFFCFFVSLNVSTAANLRLGLSAVGG
jgi:hypothetical protein